MFFSYLKNKKVLLVGLGQLGGGIATSKFLVKNGAHLTITDNKTKDELKKSIAQLKNLKIKYSLGGHKIEDFKNADIVVFNPAVSFFSPWVKECQKLKKEFFNDYTLFLKLLESEKINLKTIGITGTRGKTTTTSWVGHFLSPSITGGNIPTSGLLKIIEKTDKKLPFVLELSSYQLEYLSGKPSQNFNKKDLFVRSFSVGGPHIAVITNLSPDHLNRYGAMEKYARVKANIFSNQNPNDFLILNYDDKWTEFFLEQGPKSQIFYFSLKKLPSEINGIYFENDKIYFQIDGPKDFISEQKDLSPHEKRNLLCSLLACHLYGKPWASLLPKIKSLPQVEFRQQKVYSSKNLQIINDSTATSPEGTIAAIEKFCSKKTFLITGGTDKGLDFKSLALNVKKYIKERNLFLLSGSATEKLLSELKKIRYFKKPPQVFNSLKEIMEDLSKIKKGTILFSPASASFEKFKNEFDRGKIFNKLVKEYFGGR